MRCWADARARARNLLGWAYRTVPDLQTAKFIFTLIEMNLTFFFLRRLFDCTKTEKWKPNRLHAGRWRHSRPLSAAFYSIFNQVLLAICTAHYAKSSGTVGESGGHSMRSYTSPLSYALRQNDLGSKFSKCSTENRAPPVTWHCVSLSFTLWVN